jgi:YfiH family protein
MTAPFLISKRLSELKGVRHAFFTRKGGVSTGVYDSLNTGPGSNDDADAVAENRRRAAEALGLGAEALVTCYQIHSTMTRVTEQPWGDRRPEGDAVVTRTPGVLCGALSADCAPVLMVDPQARVVAAVHAGWKGALDGVVQSAVKAMEAEGARADRIVAAVGPCIAQSSYEVGPEFLQRFAAHDPGSERFFKRAPTPGKHLFDLPRFVLWRLEQAGVGEAEWMARDTCADETLFFSNRRSFKQGEGDYGRLLSAIAIA